MKSRKISNKFLNKIFIIQLVWLVVAQFRKGLSSVNSVRLHFRESLISTYIYGPILASVLSVVMYVWNALRRSLHLTSIKLYIPVITTFITGNFFYFNSSSEQKKNSLGLNNNSTKKKVILFFDDVNLEF